MIYIYIVPDAACRRRSAASRPSARPPSENESGVAFTTPITRVRSPAPKGRATHSLQDDTRARSRVEPASRYLLAAFPQDASYAAPPLSLSPSLSLEGALFLFRTVCLLLFPNKKIIHHARANTKRVSLCGERKRRLLRAAPPSLERVNAETARKVTCDTGCAPRAHVTSGAGAKTRTASRGVDASRDSNLRKFNANANAHANISFENSRAPSLFLISHARKPRRG